MPNKHPIAEPSKAPARPPEPQAFQLPGFERHWVPPCDESEGRQLHQDVLRDIAHGGLAPDVVNRTFIQQEAQRICDWVDWQILNCLERYPGMERSTLKNRYFTRAMRLIERGRLLHYAELAPQITDIVERAVAHRFSRTI